MQVTSYSQIKQVGKTVVVRPYQYSDFSNCVAARKGRQLKVNEFDSVVPPSKDKDKVSFTERVKRYRRLAREQHQFVFGVFTKESGEFVGQVDLMVINKQLRWGNLGYQIHNQFWGKGYATEAAKLALKVAFRNLKFHRIEAGVEPRNTASLKVAKKVGLVLEGLRKKFFPDKGGIDLIFFGANAIDFKKTSSKQAKYGS